MTISISGNPQTLSPVFNPIHFYPASSGATTLEGFKYIVDIYSANTTTKIATYKLFPSPTLGLGVADINQILSTQVSYTFPTTNDWNLADESFVNYYIQFGAEYVSNWTYDNLVALPNYTNLVNTSNLTIPYSVGDLIYIENPTPSNADLPGVYQVLSAYTFFGSSIVTIGTVGLTTDIGVTDGLTIFADHRKSQFTGLKTTNNYTAFNGSIPHMEFNDYYGSGYTINSASAGTERQWLTSVPDEYEIRIENDMYVNMYQTPTSGASNWAYLEILTDNGGTYQFKIPGSLSATTEPILQLAIGPNNLNNWVRAPSGQVGGMPPIKAITTRYTAHTFNTSFVQSSKDYVFKINQKCNPKYTNVELLFLDRMGSWMPANFELRNTKKINIQRNMYQKTLGDLNTSTGRWGYNSNDRGMTVLNTTFNTESELTSNWMSETNGTFLEELFTSPEVYIKINSEYWPVIIKNTDYVFKTKLNEKLINYTITIEYSNSNRVQAF